MRQIYYEEKALEYPLGKYLMEKFKNDIWIPIESHNKIPELSSRPNSDFLKMKNYIIIGVRKTHKYVKNNKTSDFLVPYTSSGCGASCMYCYLVCNFNKCSYLRLFVNREEMLERLLKKAREGDFVFEIGSNSDLVLENAITKNLVYTIENFAKLNKSHITFPTKFAMCGDLLSLNHGGRTIVRMSLNPEEIIKSIERGTSPLDMRLSAIEKLWRAGYRVGILIAPVIFLDGYKDMYVRLLDKINDVLPENFKKVMEIEIIFMTYSFVHRKINEESFGWDLYDSGKMTGRGRGKYWYKGSIRAEGEAFLREEIKKRFPYAKILYVV